MIFTAPSLLRPNSSRTICTMSSAWLSSLAKISVLGMLASRPSSRRFRSLKILGSESRSVRTTVRWNVNTRRDAGTGSSPHVKRVSAPVDS